MDGLAELVNFDTFAFNSCFIRSITLSLQNLLQFDSLDPCPVIFLPETSPGIIKKVEAILQTGTCDIRDRKEAQEVLEVANLLRLPISMLVPENESCMDTSSPIVFSGFKVKTEPDVPNQSHTPSSSNDTATISNEAATEPQTMVKGYKCAICKKPGGNVSTSRKKDTIFHKEIQLEAHYIGQHFKKEIENHIKDHETCGICGKNVTNGRLPLHIGLIHHKIKSILKAANIAVEASYFPGVAQGSSPNKSNASPPKTKSSPRLSNPHALVRISSTQPFTPSAAVKTMPPAIGKISSTETVISQSPNKPPNTDSSIRTSGIMPRSPMVSSPTPTARATKSKEVPLRSPEGLGKATPTKPKSMRCSPMKPISPVVSTPPTKAAQAKGGPRRGQGGSAKKTLPKPTLPVHLRTAMTKDVPSTPKRTGAIERLVTPLVGNVTPDNRSKRDSILSNFDSPEDFMQPLDEFVTKGSNSKPDKRSNKKPLTSLNCNYDLTCEVCAKDQKTALALEIHTIAHFKEDLETKVRCYMTDDNKCTICGDAFKTKNWLITHLGSKHGYINMVLVDKGFSVLPCTVNSSGYTASKQQQLVKIKTERKEPMEQEAVQPDDMRDELMRDTGTPERNSDDVLN